MIEEDFLIEQMTVDDFGVPSNIMGLHPEKFFSMLGRIVSLAATLENKTLGFYQDLAVQIAALAPVPIGPLTTRPIPQRRHRPMRPVILDTLVTTRQWPSDLRPVAIGTISLTPPSACASPDYIPDGFWNSGNSHSGHRE